MKRIILALILLFGISNLNAKNNKIEAGMSGLVFFNALYFPYEPFNAFNIKYTRNINNKLALYTQYTRAPLYTTIIADLEPLFEHKSIGKPISMDKYNYFDLGINYKIYQKSNHQLTTFSGLSIAHGENAYLMQLATIPTEREPDGHVVFSLFEPQKETYIGGILGIGYDYAFWKDRLNIGVNISARKYLNKNNVYLEVQHPDLQHLDPNIPGGRHSFPFQINYGIHLGFNF